MFPSVHIVILSTPQAAEGTIENLIKEAENDQSQTVEQELNDSYSRFRSPSFTLSSSILSLILPLTPTFVMSLVREKHRIALRHETELTVSLDLGCMRFVCSFLFLAREFLEVGAMIEILVNEIVYGDEEITDLFQDLPSRSVFGFLCFDHSVANVNCRLTN